MDVGRAGTEEQTGGRQRTHHGSMVDVVRLTLKGPARTFVGASIPGCRSPGGASPRSSTGDSARVKRWLVALLGIALAAAAFFAVAKGRRTPLWSKPAPNALPHAEIDDASRKQLERVIRGAEHEEPRPR